MVINDTKNEYLYFDEYNMSVKTFIEPTHGMLIAWIMECTDWRGDNIRMINDTGNEYIFDEARKQYKNREMDFVAGYNKFIDDLDGFGLFTIEK